MCEGGAKCESGNAPHSKDFTCMKTMAVWQEEELEVSFNFFVKPTDALHAVYKNQKPRTRSGQVLHHVTRHIDIG
jgi:hypothetical protein